jgi:hypothetical protein
MGANVMLPLIKKYLLQPIKQVITPIYQRTLGQWKKRRLFLRMQKKHQALLAQIKGKESIRVVFLAIHKSVWKVDLVFQRMLADPCFEPIVLVCPYTDHGEERMWEDMRECLVYFSQKGYPTYPTYREEEQRWIKLEELAPDIVFFTNPHNLTRREYYKDAYLNYLTCYVPYFTDVASNYDLNSVYNKSFHNSLWISFLPDMYSKSRALSVIANGGKNFKVVGSLLFEEMQSSVDSNKHIWKIQALEKKKIIYATHQSINSNDVVNLSTFLYVGELIKRLAIKYQDYIQWSFRPHPILKSKLYSHQDWGPEKTDAYYEFWKTEAYTQLDEGGYVDLFKTSDAMIHDCGSFIVDYLYVNKPCAYILINREVQLGAVNDQGIRSLEFYHKLTAHEEIEDFIEKIHASRITTIPGHKGYIKDLIKTGFDELPPSEMILNNLKNEAQISA